MSDETSAFMNASSRLKNSPMRARLHEGFNEIVQRPDNTMPALEQSVV
jgi:hypothetical protein